MSLTVNHLYQFDKFRLDTGEKILTRDDKLLELTPKAFELLTLFVENHGRLLKKEEIMQKIWADSFVEESNLTFNIGQIRKVLGDDPRQPRFIKTVRQHGYRFIADVKTLTQEIEVNEEIPAPPPSAIDTAPAQSERPKTGNMLKLVIVAGIILLVGMGVIASLYVRSRNSRSNAPILATPFGAEKLSDSGKVFNAALSPDGKSVVYSSGAPNEKQSIWLRQLEDGSNVEIIPPSDNTYVGAKFSPDGKLLYFVRHSRQSSDPPSIYRVSVFGGIPQKIVDVSEGWFSVSPDGTRISFIRCLYRDDEYCALWTADAADGQNERKLAARSRPIRIADNQFSPDGKKIAFAAGHSFNASNDFGLSLIDLESGREQEFTNEKFFNIKSLGWLPDQRGILMTARKSTERHFRIWQVSTVGGEALPLTKDSETYSIVALDKDATKLVATKIKQDFRLKLLNADNPEIDRVLASASTVAFAPDGRIVFSSTMSGNGEIWIINQDGSSQRQLTNNAAEESIPIVSADNKSIFFASNQTGAAQVWRMNIDGSNQTQITHKDGGAPLRLSPDGEWLYYHQSISAKLMRHSLKTGEEQLIHDKPKTYFAVSPDGSQFAFAERQHGENSLTIANIPDGKITKAFSLADKKLFLGNIVWSPDGQSLFYVTSNAENDNDVLWKQPLSEQTPQQIIRLSEADIANIYSIAVSPDNKTYAVVQGKWLHDAVLIKGLQ